MNRTYIGDFNILGAGMCEWPVKVWLSQNKKTHLWTVFYRFTDPEQLYSDSDAGLNVKGIFQTLESRGIKRSAFLSELEYGESNEPELAELATALRRLLEEPITEASSSGSTEKPTEEPSDHES
ncbi:MAG: hypothetical protein K8R87_06770 [Verrucomicrobia bacterium]|nr:hypothetical protein [Verrucomicrobiota bacterium]